MTCEHGEWYIKQGNMVCGRGCEGRASDIIEELTRERDEATGERDRLTWLLHSVSRTHGLGDHVKKRIQHEVTKPDPGDGWSPYKLQQDVKRLEGQVEHKDEALRAAIVQMGEFQEKYHAVSRERDEAQAESMAFRVAHENFIRLLRTNPVSVAIRMWGEQNDLTIIKKAGAAMLVEAARAAGRGRSVACGS